jgi:hypothetical protein
VHSTQSKHLIDTQGRVAGTVISGVSDQQGQTSIVNVQSDGSDDFLSDGPLGRNSDHFHMRSYFAGLKHRKRLRNGGADGNNSWAEIGDNTPLMKRRSHSFTDGH